MASHSISIKTYGNFSKMAQKAISGKNSGIVNPNPLQPYSMRFQEPSPVEGLGVARAAIEHARMAVSFSPRRKIRPKC